MNTGGFRADLRRRGRPTGKRAEPGRKDLLKIVTPEALDHPLQADCPGRPRRGSRPRAAAPRPAGNKQQHNRKSFLTPLSWSASDHGGPGIGPAASPGGPGSVVKTLGLVGR